MKALTALTLDEVRGQPGLSRAACDALVASQPATILQALRIRGVGRKTTKRLFALGLLTDPEGVQNRGLTLEDLRDRSSRSGDRYGETLSRPRSDLPSTPGQLSDYRTERDLVKAGLAEGKEMKGGTNKPTARDTWERPG